MERLTWNCIPLGKIGNELFMPFHPPPTTTTLPLHCSSAVSRSQSATSHWTERLVGSWLAGWLVLYNMYYSCFCRPLTQPPASSSSFEVMHPSHPLPSQQLHAGWLAATCLAQYVSIKPSTLRDTHSIQMS